MSRVIFLFLVIFICFIFYSISVNAQNTIQPKIRTLYLGINYGLNYSKIKIDSLDFSGEFLPSLGLNLTKEFSKKINLRVGSQFSMRGATSIRPFIKYTTTYTDFQALAQYRLGTDFKIEGGIQYANLIYAKADWQNENVTSSAIKNINSFTSQLEIITGIEFKLRPKTDMAIRYSLPLNNLPYQNLQFAINYKFNKKSFSKHKIEKHNALKQLVAIKQGGLLVRLKTSQNKINALKQVGRIDEAREVEQIQREINLKIVKAFKENFDYGKVYFFYSSESEKIKNRQFRNVFLNDDLQLDSTIIADTSRFLIAEFDKTVSDTTRNVDFYYHDKQADGSVKHSARRYATTYTGLPALVIKSDQFIQLKEPFPYYVRTYSHTFYSINYKATVRKLNRKLKRLDRKL